MKICLLPFLLIAHLYATSQSLTIRVTGVRSSSGSIRVAFYNNAEDFAKEKALFIRTASKAGMSGGVVSIVYTDLKPGTYGVAVLDDENSNREMDYGLILPEEGFGFSDYYHSGMSRPTFDKFDFTLGSETKATVVKIRYL